MKGHMEVEKVSRLALEEFAKANGLTTSDMAKAAGYCNQAAYCNAKKNGYMSSEKVFNLCNFFNLPRDYFEGAHEALGDLAIVEKDRYPLAKFSVINTKDADCLLEFYGDVDYTSLFMRLVKQDVETHKAELTRKKYEGMSVEELIDELVRRDAEA